MTTIREAVLAVLTDDSTLAGLATGGIHDSDSAGRDGMRRELLMVSGTPGIRPGVFVRWGTDTPFGVAQRSLGAQRLMAEVFFYQDDGYDKIISMRERVKTLLEYAPVQFDEPGGYWMADIFWRGDVLAMVDDEMGGACFERSRYEILYTSVPS